ncbi:MAG: DUF4340 domain-containing protein [Opitutaceae bacterium]
MKLKTLIVCVVALTALSLVVFFVRRPAPLPSADPRINQTLADRAAVDKAAKLRLSDQGKSVTLVRQSDGTWVVPSYYDLPADFPKLSGFVGNLTEAKLQRLVTSSPERIGRLEFKDTKVELLDATDKVLWSVTLGKNAESGGGRYVRFGDEPKAFLADFNGFLDAEPKNWAKTELVNLKPEEIAKIEVPFAEGGPVTLSRAKKEDAWAADKTPAGQRVMGDKISSLLNTLGTLRFTETSEPIDANAVAAKANSRAFKLTTFDGTTTTVTLGRKPEEKRMKPPTATAAGKSGPAALGSASDLLKEDDKSPAAVAAKNEAAKALSPEFETIPAGPVFVFIASSDAAAPVNTWMQKRAFQIAEFTFTSLPEKAEELFEPTPAPLAAPAAASAGTPKAGEEKSDAKK